MSNDPPNRDARITVREATADDRVGVRRVLDAAMLDVRADLRERIAAGDVLVASESDREETGDNEETADRENSSERDAPILGALVLVPDDERDADLAAHDDAARIDAAHIDAVAVRRARRGQGIGSELVCAAAARHARLTAAFDPGVRPFYDALDFEISPVEGDSDRLRGRYDGGET